MFVRSLQKRSALYNFGKQCFVQSSASLSTEARPSNLIFMDDSVPPIKEIKEYSNMPKENSNIIRKIEDNTLLFQKPVLIWLSDFLNRENFAMNSEAVELHPEIFGCSPRMDYLGKAIAWQKVYRTVDYSWEPTRADIGKGKAKPWPQKGSGRARHGSTNAPQWHRGAKAKGPRGPMSLYYEQPFHERVRALTSALTVRQIQNDLFIVKDFIVQEGQSVNFETDNSMLIVHGSVANDVSDSTLEALDNLPKVNLISVLALNVFSILKHDKLVITLPALKEIENKLTWHLHRYEWLGDKPHNFYTGMPFSPNVESSELNEELHEADIEEEEYDHRMKEYIELDTHEIPYGRM